jgi:hypothetical protein
MREDKQDVDFIEKPDMQQKLTNHNVDIGPCDRL